MKQLTSFIKATEEYSTVDKFVPAPYMRRSFEISGDVNTAKLTITGIGFYEVYINGRNITKGYLAPYRTNPEQMVYFDEYDIKEHLNVGKNTIGLILGNGMGNSTGGISWFFDKFTYRSAPKTAFELDLTYSDGESETVISDTETLTAPSPIIFDDLHFGEYYDARKEIQGWNLPEFDDSSWSRALKAETPRGEMRLCKAEPIVERNVLKPVSVTKFEDSYIYDFGINTAGICTIKIKGEAGQKVLMRHFELFIDGKPYFENVRFRKTDRYQEDEYYLSGNGTETHTPRFTYHGFRYILVSGITEEQATKDLLTCHEINSDIKRSGDFTCSDEIVNKIQEITYRSDITNFHYFPTDCPQREKNGWTADAALSAEQMLLNLTPANSYKEWMRNIYKTINDKGQIPGIIPTCGWGYDWGNGPAWDSVMVYLPYYTYKYTGDKEILKELAAPLMRYLNYLFSKLDEKDLIAIGLGDWCQAVTDEIKTPLVVTDTIYTNDIATKAAFIYDVLDMKPQKQFALILAEKTRNAFREHLINKTTLEAEGKTQTAQAMALFYGMYEENEKQKAFDVLIKYIDDKDGHFDTGVLGGKVIYRLLADNGYTELAYNMITRPDFPSYGHLIKEGATTLWERFRPAAVDQLDSYNHHFWGDVSAWFYIYLAGININPTCKDVRNIDIKPHFVNKLENVNAYHDTPNGRITVNWSKNDGCIFLRIVADARLYGKISLPKGYSFENFETEAVLKTGEYKVIRV